MVISHTINRFAQENLLKYLNLLVIQTLVLLLTI